MNIDVTERDRALALLRRREREFESLMAHAPDIISRLDRGFHHLYVSPAITATTGRLADDFIGKTVAEVGLPPDIVDQWETVLKEVFATGREQTLECVYEVGGASRYYESRIIPEQDVGGAVATVLVLTRDFTERKRVEELLRLRKQEFESLAENLPDLVARYDRDRRFLYVNSAIERTLGVERARTFGRTQRELGLPEELVTLYDDSLGQVFETGLPHKVEFRLALPDGERYFEAFHVPEGGVRHRVETVLCVARDITERRQAELAAHRGAALARLLESLARAANEALTPEAAMVACLDRICSYGRWVLGRVEIFERGRAGDTPGRSIWHTPEHERFAEFIQITNGRVHIVSGPFIGRLLRERTAVWIDDLQQRAGFGRWESAIKHGLRSAFAFPIIVRGDVVAIMEVFSEEVRAQDPLIMGAAQSLASQLARIVEREWAHQTNTRMAAIVESSQDAILSRALDGTILTWNAGAERLFGYTATEIIGRNIEILYPPELKTEIFHRQGLLLEGQAVQAYETLRVAKDGRRIQVSTSPAPIRDFSGKLCGVSTIMRDITERKLGEQALSESEERFRQLAENIHQVFWIATPALDKLIYISPAYEEIWGRSCESLYRDPRSFMDAIHPDDQPRVLEEVKKMARGERFGTEYRVIRPDGTQRWIRDCSYPMKAGDDGSPLNCGICEDITDIKQAEQERLTKAIGQRDALVREVHHRIKNNLQGVVGLLRQKMRKFPAVAPSIEEAIVQLQAVAVVYGLQGTRADGLLNLAEMVEAICASAEGLIGGHVDRTFERKTPRPVCVVGSEAVSMAVALNELVFNALKHQPAEAGKKRAQVRLSETRNAAEIRITNRGHLPRTFDFSAGRAVGNGLELVRTLLAPPGASIEFNNGRNKVEVVVRLSPPLLAARQTAIVRRGEHGGANGKKSATAHTGRG